MRFVALRNPPTQHRVRVIGIRPTTLMDLTIISENPDPE